MLMPKDTHQKLMSAYDLLSQGSISIGSFENIRTVLKGIHPGVDEKLEICSKALEKLQKLQSGDVISLTVEGLPEETEEKKKRKKTLLFLINSIKNLQSEIKRVEKEFKLQQNKSGQQNVKSWGRIIGSAKGPLGLVTIAAIAIVGVSLFLGSSKKQAGVSQPLPTSEISGQLVKVIMFGDKQIPLSQFWIGQGPDCGGGGVPHYHAAQNGVVTAMDGTKIQDPEGCGFGKVSETKVIEVQK